MKFTEGGVTAAKGFEAAGAEAQIKYKNRMDMALVYSKVPCVSAGTFTSNVVKAAPVLWDKNIVDTKETAQAVVVNSGIANACTGKQGMDICKKEAECAGRLLGIPADAVLVASTGVIGMQIPEDRICAGIEKLAAAKTDTLKAGNDAARAIMTTDTVFKEVAVEIELSGKKVTLGGMCKGSGMIHPNMCTMLGFVTTDAAISKELLVKAVKKDVIDSFNMISVDGDRTILKELDWTVMRGQKWALSGENGAGKSTLLSLVCADNPQSYACDIRLFGRKRGTGESIWEIKKHIGYVSPEMHRAYLKNLPAIEIVASGLHDSIGLYKRPHAGQMAVCEWWMDIFGVAHLKDEPFLQLSSGEQRLALLARAFVKDPELLILDEPLHGLDTYNRRRVRKIIEAFCRRRDKTMIMVTHYENELPETITHRLSLTRNR